MRNPYPHELAVGDVYFSPILAVLFISFAASVLTVFLLDRMKISRWFYLPEYIFIAIMIIYMVLIDRYWIRF